MKAYRLEDPDHLSQKRLAAFVREIQSYMYREDSGEVNPKVEFSDTDLAMFLEELMWNTGLSPIETGPKDWSPKRQA